MFIKKKMKQNIARILIAILLCSNNGMFCFADSVENIVQEYNQEEIKEPIYESKLEKEEGLEEKSEEIASIPEEDISEVEESALGKIAIEIEEEVVEELEEEIATESEVTVEKMGIEVEEPEEEVIEPEEELEAEEEVVEELKENDIASDSEIIDEIAIEDFSNDNMMLGSLFGVVIPQTITLDFGFGPQFDKTTNWADPTSPSTYADAIAKFTHIPGDSKYSITGQSSTLITDVFNGTIYPDLSYGSGVHVQLPKFDTADNAIWEGYKFVCWQDEEGRNLTEEQNGTFLYAFQNTGDVTYKAYWEKVENPYHLKVDFISERTSTQSTVFPFGDAIDENVIHRQNVYVQPANIQGFKIEKVSPRVDGAELPTEPLKALKTLNYNGTDYLDMSSEDIVVDSETYEVHGAMPNHPLDIKMCYVPNPEQTYKFTINYIDMDSNNSISSQNVQFLTAETLLDYKPLELDNYRYENAVVECGPRSILTGALELGYLTLDGQIIAPTDKTDESENQGRIYTLMPNQDLTITYKYTLISNTAEITVNKHMQQRDGSYVTNPEIIHLAPSSGETIGSFIVENKENIGYAQPEITNNNPTLPIVSYNYTPGIGGANGEYKFYTTAYTNCTIDVVYNYDYNSAYWGKVEYYAYNTVEGHGHIEAASGSLALDNRYFKRDTYTISQLLEDIDIIPETNYMYKVYKNNSTTPGPMGEAFDLDSTIELGSSLSFFINFEEDPNCWIDINFAAAPQSTLIGETHIHVSKDTPVASLSYPTVILEVGYMHVGGYWQDANGNLLGDPLTDITESLVTYYPVVVSTIGEYSDAVKPLVYTEYSSNGKGIAKLYTRYSSRKYILTDRNEKILSIKNGSELANGFTDLYPGTTYHLYEVMSGTPHPSIGAIMVSGDGISDKCVFGIGSVNSNYGYDEANLKISITPVQGVSYALLDDQYNITYSWTTNPQFLNLTNGTYYLIVAKQTGDTIDVDDENAIRNGTVVFTEKVDLSTRHSRLVLIGQNALARNMTYTETTGTGANKKTIYSLQSDRNVTLIGATNAKWQVCSENATLTSMTSQMPTSFTMPSEDTIIRNYIEPSASLRYKAEYHTKGSKMAFVNEGDILTKLNEDTNIHDAIDSNGIIKHYIAITKRPTAKSVVTSLDGKIAPYEYAVDVISEVNEKPYPNSKCNELDLSVYVAFEESVVGNKNYTLTDGTFTPLYSTTTDTDIGSGTMNLSVSNNVAIMYEKVHRLEIRSSVDDSVNDVYFVSDNKKMSESIPSYSTDVQSRFNNYFDMSGVTQESASTYNAKEYLFQGVYDGTNVFDATNSIIKKQINILVRYTLNTEREYYKELLNFEISGAIEKESILITQSLKNLLGNAILQAKDIKDHQKDYTVEEIKNEYESLHDLVINTNDPPQLVEIILDANGGVVNPDTISVYKGNSFTYATLSNVSKNRDGYNFLSWNTEMNGSGTTIMPNSIVGNNPPTVLYAIWQVVNNNPTPTRVGGRSGGSGGGGGGGSRAPATVGDQVVVKPITFDNPFAYDKKIMSMTSVFPGFTNAIVYSDDKIQPYYIYDQFNNKLNLYFSNKETSEIMKAQWLTFERHLGDELRYQTHLLNVDGIALTGFQVIDNTVYYLDEEAGEHYSTLTTGWIYDKKGDKWFYASPITGELLGGWQNINGKDYYFMNNKSVDAEGKEYISENDVKNGYGVMLKSCMTPDGYMLDENGERIVLKP